MRSTGKKRLSRSFGGDLLARLFMIAAGLFTAIPLIYSVLNAFKPVNELYQYPPRFFVLRPTADNFLDLFRLQQDMLVPIERYAFNSILVTFAATAGYIIIASLAAYPMAKHRFHGKTVVISFVVGAILFRTEVTSVPQFIILSKLGLVDTYGALIFPAFAASFGVFLMKQFMEQIPNELIEAAKVDGASELCIFRRIVMSICRPAWLTLAILTFQSVWNQTGVQYIYDEALKTLPAALSQLGTSGLSRVGVTSAVTFLLMLPPIVMFAATQSAVMETMAYSGLKG